MFRSRYFWLNLLWLAVIFILCTLSFDKLPNVNPPKIPYLDKVAHFALFYVMGFLMISWFYKGCRYSFFKSSFILLVTGSFYGALIEWLQGTYFNRSTEILDLFWDIVGIVLAILTYPLVSMLFRKMRRKKAKISS